MPAIDAEKLKYYWRQAGFLVLFCLMTTLPAEAVRVVETVPVAEISIDDEGERLDYPAAVFFDKQREELYIVNGSTGRIVVYGSDYFPRWSIGAGRKVITPGGGAVLPDGRVFAVQIKNRSNPQAKITILNGAFFPELEIPLDDIPGAEDFIPRNVVISKSGLIYVSGDLYRGVLVLDDEGYFLRKLQPKDQLASLSSDYEPEKPPTEEKDAAEQEVVEEEEDAFANIPEEFRPRQGRGARISSGEKLSEGPVKVNYVDIDSQGRIYMVSPETGKIYVHDSNERFLFSFGTKGGSPGQMSNPRGLAIDEERGLIYIADYMRHTVLAYDMAGEHIFETGGRGVSAGWFNFPNDIALTSRGELIVADLFNKRVQVLEVQFEDNFYNLEDILGQQRENEEAEPEGTANNESTEEGVTESFELVPGTPDIEYEEEVVNLESESEEEPADDEEPEGAIEIEILQNEEIPAISE